MIVLGLLGIVGFFLDALPTIEFDFSHIASISDQAVSLVLQGVDVLGAFLGPTSMAILGVYLSIIVIIDSFYITYQLIWWLITKVPFLNVDP